MYVTVPAVTITRQLYRDSGILDLLEYFTVHVNAFLFIFIRLLVRFLFCGCFCLALDTRDSMRVRGF